MLAVAQNASAQATVFEAEVKDKFEEAKEQFLIKGRWGVSNGPQHGPNSLTDAEVGATIREFSMDTCWDQAVGRKTSLKQKAYSHSLVRFGRSAWRLHQLNWWILDKDKRRPWFFISREKKMLEILGEDRERIEELHRD